MKRIGWAVLIAAAAWIGAGLLPRPAPVDPALERELDSLAQELEQRDERMELLEAQRDSIARANADSIASWNDQRATLTQRIQTTTARAAEVADSIRARVDAETAELFEEDERLDAQALADAWTWGETWQREAEQLGERLEVEQQLTLELYGRIEVLEQRDATKDRVNAQLQDALEEERSGRTRDRVIAGGAALLAIWAAS